MCPPSPPEPSGTDAATPDAPGRRWPAVAVVVAAVLVGAWYARLSLQRLDAFWQARYDVGNMVQAVWSTTQGRFLESTASDGEQISRLAAHVDPLLALFAPLWWLWPSPAMLLVAQAAIVAAGALPAFWLGRLWLGDDRPALCGALAYLMYPALGWSLVTEFHPVTLAAPLIMFAVWAAATRHDVVLAVTAGLALVSKEQVGLSLAVLGVWMAVSLGRRRAGAVLAAASLAWVAFAVQVVIPHFNAGGDSVFVGSRYGDFGDSPSDVLVGVLTRPHDVVATILEPDRITYLLALLLPLAGLPLLAPLLAAGAAPDLLLNMLSSRPEQHQLEYHYVAVIVPFLVAAAIRGAARLRRVRRPAALGRLMSRPAALGAVLLVPVLLGAWRLGPLPVWQHVPGGSSWRTNEYVVDDHARVLARAVDLVPGDGEVVVSSTNHAGAHLSARRRVYTFPVVRDAEWVLVDRVRPETWNAYTDADLDRALRVLQARADMRRVFHEDGVSVFRRIADGASGQTSATSPSSSRSRTTRWATGAAASSSTSAR
jgi:uncharacterized membrane protein